VEGQPKPPTAMSMREVLGIKTMRRLWYAQIVSNFGDFLALFAVIGVLAFKLKANPQQITGVQIAYQVPIAILGILAGVFVDRWPLKRTLVSSDIIRGFLCIGLLFANQIWHYYVVLAAISIVSSFFGPAQGVVIREAVPFHGLRSSNALMQQVMFMMRIIGPAAAGVMVSSFGYNPCYIIDAASFFASACFIGSLVIKRSESALKHTAAEDKGAVVKVWHDMQQGISFIVHHAALLFVVLAMSVGMFIIGCFGPLIAVYIRDSVLPGATLQHQNTIYGLAQAMIGIGMFIGVASLNKFAAHVKNTILVYTGLLGIGVGLVVLTALTSIWSTLLGDFLIGIAVACIIIPAQTLMQQETPPALMGRVGSTFMSSVFTAQILGLLLSGALAKLTGVREVFALCAGILVLLTLAGKLFMEPKPSA
jgi:DHA3 family macrolide efflux protein-like MFS transporter